MNVTLLSIVLATLVTSYAGDKNFLDPREQKILSDLRGVVFKKPKKTPLKIFSKASRIKNALKHSQQKDMQIILECLLSKMHFIMISGTHCKCHKNNPSPSSKTIGCHKKKLANFYVLQSLQSIDMDLYEKIRNALEKYILHKYKSRGAVYHNYLKAFLNQTLNCHSYVKSYEEIVSPTQDDSINGNLGFIDGPQQDERGENLMCSSESSESEGEISSPQKEIDLNNQIPWEGDLAFLLGEKEDFKQIPWENEKYFFLE